MAEHRDLLALTEDDDALDIYADVTDFDEESRNTQMDHQSTLSGQSQQILAYPVTTNLPLRCEHMEILTPLESLHAASVRANIFTGPTVTSRYKAKFSVKPQITIVNVNVMSLSMPKPEEIARFSLPYEHNGNRNPTYLYKIMAEGRKAFLKLPFYQDLQRKNIDVIVANCEAGFIIYDSINNVNVLNKYTSTMTANEWNNQPLPRSTFDDHGDHCCYYHVSYTIDFNAKARVVQMKTQETMTFDAVVTTPLIDYYRSSASVMMNLVRHHKKTTTPFTTDSTTETTGPVTEANATPIVPISDRLGPPVPHAFANKKAKRPYENET